jgi:hypothetical protein
MIIKMHVQRQIGQPPRGGHDRHAVSDVRDETSIHHVQMQGLGASLL